MHREFSAGFLGNLAPFGRSLAAAFAAAFLFAGIGSRLAMRVTALMGGPAEIGLITDAGATVGEISRDGTMFLVFFGTMIAGLAGGALYAAARPWLPARGADVAFALLALAAGGSHLVEARNPDFAGFGSPTANVGMYVALFLLGGVATHAIYRRLERHRGARVSSVFGLLSLIVLVPAPAVFGIAGDPRGLRLGFPGSTTILLALVVVAILAQLVLARRAKTSLEDAPGWMGPRLLKVGQSVGSVVVATGLWALGGEVTAILAVDSAQAAVVITSAFASIDSLP